MLPQRLSELAESVADGGTPDWESAESTAIDQSDREAIAGLRAVASVGRFFATLTSRPSGDQGARPVLSPGSMWGTLRVSEHIGSGRFGDVYRAWDGVLDREVALKILRAPGDDAAGETDVVGEGRLMARVRHPNVVTIHGAQRIDGTTGLWMELVKGRTLSAELVQRGPFSPGELARVGIQLCSALAAVHNAGLVHRDVKAQNVLRDDTGRVVLGDFGTGRDLEDSAGSSASLAGTPTHVAPELFARGAVTPRSDLYSLGVLLFHLATRGYPVAGRCLRDLRDAHASGKRTALRALRPEFPKRLSRAIEKTLEPDPARRFASAESMARALERCLPGTVAMRQSHTRLVALAVALVVAAAASLFTWHIGRTARPAVPFAERDWVLLTRFDNRTGDPSFDGTLEYALERGLSDSAFINVVPRGRVEDTLRLMRKAANTPVDVAIGREVALRDGKIRAVVAPRIDRVGGMYSISARIIRPADGVAATSVNEVSITAPNLLRAIGRIAAGIRGQLGEAIPHVEPQGAELQKVATQSLRALQLYSKARAMTDDGVFSQSDQRTARAVEQLLRDAVREDPEFVWAQILLAHAIRVQGGSAADVLPHLERAVAAASAGVDRYIAEAELEAFSGRFSSDDAEQAQYLDRALAKFDAALQLQPDHFWALSCVLNITDDLGRRNRPELVRHWVALRPNSVVTLSFATRVSVTAGYMADAREYAKQGRAILARHGSGPFPMGAHLIFSFEARDAWRQHDARRALSAADAVLSQMRVVGPGYDLFTLYLALGRLDRAEQVALALPPDVTSRYRIVMAAERGDRDAVRRLVAEHAAKHGNLIGGSSVMAVELVSALIDADMRDVARKVIANIQRVPRNPQHHPDLPQLVQGVLATSEGRVEKGSSLLEQFIRKNGTNSLIGLRAALRLADAHYAAKDVSVATGVLEDAVRSVRGGEFSDASVQFVDVRHRLAQLYRDAGRTSEAEEIESELRQVLAVAPDDHPIKLRLAGVPARQLAPQLTLKN